MVSEAERYKAEDEQAASRIQAKNGLESYAYNLRNSIEGDLKDKIDADDKVTLEKEIGETITWLDGAQEAAKEEYEERQKSLEAVANPIMVRYLPGRVRRTLADRPGLVSLPQMKVYGAGGAPGGMPGGANGFPGAGAGAPGPGADEPSVEEVD